MVNINITYSRIKLQSLSGMFHNFLASKSSILKCDSPRSYVKSMFYRLAVRALAGRVHTQELACHWVAISFMLPYHMPVLRKPRSHWEIGGRQLVA